MASPLRLLTLLPTPERVPFASVVAEHGFEVVAEDGLGGFLRRLGQGPWSGVVLSLSVPSVDERVVERVAEQGGRGALFLSSGDFTLERALLMQRVGATALWMEPLDASDLRTHLALLHDEGDVVPLPEYSVSSSTADAPAFLGRSAVMRPVFEAIARVAGTRSTVLVTGESGTGKEVVARTLHAASDRRSGPFVPVNCSAIPENLLESELFGHEKGAFTGAVARRVGRFEKADRGTLFLDEIGDMSLVLQAKLLRVLEDQVVEPIGDAPPRKVDVRIVAATNRALEARIRSGDFREDLYYRLAVVHVEVPPLRARRDDIRTLALHFAAQYATAHGRPLEGITERALARLETMEWPGNVRELRNVIDRATVLATPPVIRVVDLRSGIGSPSAAPVIEPTALAGYPTTFSLDQVERDHIQRVLGACEGHIGRAADALGVHRNTLARKIQEHGVRGGDVTG